MARRKIKKWVAPPIDGVMKNNKTYLALNTKAVTKIEAAIIFKDRFGVEPETVFIGKPKGSITYAGPIPKG